MTGADASERTTRTTASASGKVLIVGGYAVLERPNPGLVIAVDARFTVQLRWSPTTHAALPDGAVRVDVESRQWDDWKGSYLFGSAGSSSVESTSPDATSILCALDKDSSRNKYIEDTLAWSLAYARQVGGFARVPEGHALHIALFADNDFYSQQGELKERGMPMTSASLKLLPKHNAAAVKGQAVAKTGLGSSAAMITAMVAGVLAHLNGAPKNDADLETIHRVAQIIHGAVQGKIGSGFDVCAAVQGSCEYVRYDPDVMKPVLTAADAIDVKGLKLAAWAAGTKVVATAPSGPLFARYVKSSEWNHVVASLALPPGVSLVCGDVAGGSETPSMSRAILQWKEKSDKLVWNRLLASNEATKSCLHRLLRTSAAKPAAYEQVRRSLALIPSTIWAIAKLEGEDEVGDVQDQFVELAKAFAEARSTLRLVGELAGVPVEPPEQTSLCDKTLASPGVLAAGVPGAGGYDAIFALVLGEEAREKVEATWGSIPGVCPLLLREAERSTKLLLTSVRDDLVVEPPQKKARAS